MVAKNSNQKLGESSADEIIRAQLRKLNLSNDAELKVLIAIAEKNGFIVQYDEKSGDISMKKDDTLPEKQSRVTTINEKKLAEAITPYITSAINAAFSKKPSNVDSSALIANNKVLMKNLEGKLNKYFGDMKEKLFSSLNTENNTTNKPITRFGGSNGYKVEGSQFGVVPNHTSGTTEKEVKFPRTRAFLNNVYEDIIYSWYKCAAYVVTLCCVIVTISMWYENYRLEQVAKEYYIIKPVLKTDPHYSPLIQTLDSAILSSGVDEICERVYGNSK